MSAHGLDPPTDSLDDRDSLRTFQLGGRDRVELYFDDYDAEGITESPRDSLHLVHKSDLDDGDIWFSDEVESIRTTSPLLEYADDDWAWSQSTTVVWRSPLTDASSLTLAQETPTDVEDLALGYFQPQNSGTALSDLLTCDVPTELSLDDEETTLDSVDDLLHAEHTSSWHHDCSWTTKQDEFSISADLALTHDSSFDPGHLVTSPYLSSRPVGAPCDLSTSYLPIPMDDDPEIDFLF